jgi:predicted dehydrogenase
MAAGSVQELPPVGPPVKFGLIGIGQWGKEILATLSRLPSAHVTALCDTYAPYLKKGSEIATKAAAFSDYRQLLDSRDVEAVIVATPSHQHREIALAALQAGKHVYCEVPFATTLADAQAIALAAQESPKQRFQSGLQGRSNALYRHVSYFVKSGVLGVPAQVVAQWNRKQSWRRMAPAPEREQELNWRLSMKTSIGLVGEIGIHQLDLIGWYLRGHPISATGTGAIRHWNDGRDVPDTIQCILDYPNNVRATFSSTLVNSFSGCFTLFEGSDSSLMMREKRAWMVKEADSPLLGWEVYARKESIHDETGICLVADATKLIEAGKEPGKDGSLEPAQNALYLALEDFTRSIREGTNPAAGAVEGYQATAVAIKTNAAISSGTRIDFRNSLFELKRSQGGHNERT